MKKILTVTLLCLMLCACSFAQTRPSYFQLKDTPILSPMSYGAVGDGITDDTVAIQAWLTAIDSTGSIGFLPEKDFLCSDPVYGYNVTIIGANRNTSRFIFTDDGYLYLGGLAPTELSTIASDLHTYDNNISLSSAATLSRGDVIGIVNTASGSYSAREAYYYAGEFLVVQSDVAASTTIPIRHFARRLYETSADISVRKMNLSRINLSNFSIDGHATALEGLRISNSTGRVENVSVIGGQYAGILVENAYGMVVTGVDVEMNDTNTGNNYGISISNCQNVTFDAVTAHGVRKGIDFGGSAQGTYHTGITNSDIKIVNCTLSSRDVFGAGLGSHGNVDGVIVSHSTLYGAELSGDRVLITNCDVYPPKSSTGSFRPLFNISEPVGMNFKINNNFCFPSVPGSTGPGKILGSGFTTATTKGGVFEFCDNTISLGDETAGSGRYPIDVSMTGSPVASYSMFINRNKYTGSSSSFSVGIQIYSQPTAYGDITQADTIEICGNSFGGAIGIDYRWPIPRNLRINDNNLECSTYGIFLYTQDATNGVVDISRNIIRGGSGYSLWCNDNDGIDLKLSENVVANNDGAGYYINGVQNLKLINNALTGTSTATYSYLIGTVASESYALGNTADFGAVSGSVDYGAVTPY